MRAIMRAVFLAIIGVAVLFPSATQAKPWCTELPGADRFLLVFGGEAVLDKETGLTWEANPTGGQVSFASAVGNCLNLNIGNRRGWRLPTIEELNSLFDPTQVGHPYLPAGHPFQNIDGIQYWSSSQHVDSSSMAYFLNLGAASINVFSEPKTNSKFHWCVRGGSNKPF